MMAASAFSSNFVSSVEDFQALFAPNSGDRLLLCHEAIRDDVTAAGLTAFEDAVGAAVATHAVNVRLHIWDCSSGAFAAARQQLGKETGAPLLLVVYQQTIADTFSKPLPALTQDVARVCERLATFQRSGKIATVSTASPHTTDDGLRMTVDVSRLLEMGKRLMMQGNADYAAKFFQRAVDTLDVVAPQCDGDSDVDGSTALCLAWAGLALLVQGRSADAHVVRLQQQRYATYGTEAGGDVARTLAAHRLMCAMPFAWRSDTCSQRRLREVLATHPHSHDHRCALVVTLFLAGDMQRCLTEAVKLHALHVPFGATAIAAVSDFMGRDHPLVQALGIDGGGGSSSGSKDSGGGEGAPTVS